MIGWYFAEASRRLRYDDDRPIVVGETHEVDGPPVLCEHGLHASERILDALQYAPGPVVYRVELSGEIVHGEDKSVATRRTYLAGGVDVTDILRRFAREQALSVAHLWDMPDVVRRYLETGDESIQVAAGSAARAAAWSAARAAASAAARAAAWSAVWSAAGSAAEAAAEAAEAAVWAAEAATKAAADTRLTEMIEEVLR